MWLSEKCSSFSLSKKILAQTRLQNALNSGWFMFHVHSLSESNFFRNKIDRCFLKTILTDIVSQDNSHRHCFSRQFSPTLFLKMTSFLHFFFKKRGACDDIPPTVPHYTDTARETTLKATGRYYVAFHSVRSNCAEQKTTRREKW